MPSDGEHSTPPAPGAASKPTRQRRTQRSCDICRQRKSDGPSGSSTKCSNCLDFGCPCTYIDPPRKRGPKNKLVEELQQRIAVLEDKLRSPSICSLCARPLQCRSNGASTPSVLQHAPETNTTSTGAEPQPPEELAGDISQYALVDRFGQMSMKDEYFGAASGFALVNNVIAVSTSRQDGHSITHLVELIHHVRRQWEEDLYNQRPHYVYPECDLIASLLELYFTNVHPTFPVLHRPSFEQCVAKKLHLSDPGFGAVLLAVLAIASRYSDDPRVMVDGNPLSSGWKFVAQVQVVRTYFKPSIHQVQFYCVSSRVVVYSQFEQVSWLYLGLGIRFLQHRGEYCRKREDYEFKNELWNRAFWSLAILDRMAATFTGRPATIRMEEYDVEPPLEVDDEYWDHGFAQPLGEPSFMSYFGCFSRLWEVSIKALRRLYASNKCKIRMDWIGIEWEQNTVAELDTAMNDFFDSIPPHLRWDPNRRGAFFEQSAILHVTYYYAQITIHRPYIHKQNALAVPSLSICTDAARSALYIADIWINRLQRVPLPFLLAPVFVSAVVLLLNIFGSKRAGLPIDIPKDLAHVETALRVLKFTKSR
ncbi:fungal-specific transcription factor domain-containing protein [Mycena maculata]|uniref:Fungal-specific transcription factor domain-containing protein n=1 Tax=Mycena maculata TaxID=230809 RepID=A0AAD7KBI0_9AGAR|nr:fungal-specific transcription factor domain-containing protein [Mycena maculata]